MNADRKGLLVHEGDEDLAERIREFCKEIGFDVKPETTVEIKGQYYSLKISLM